MINPDIINTNGVTKKNIDIVFPTYFLTLILNFEISLTKYIPIPISNINRAMRLKDIANEYNPRFSILEYLAISITINTSVIDRAPKENIWFNILLEIFDNFTQLHF